MKPDWDKLMEEYKDSKTVLIADVDCTTAGKELCTELGVRGYPTIKYGDPNNLEEYKGGRTFDDMKKHAEENLGPTCGPDNLDLCNDEQKKVIEKFQVLPAADLDAYIEESTTKIETAEANSKKVLEALQKQYEDANKKKDEIVEGIKNSGYGFAKAVKAANKRKEEV